MSEKNRRRARQAEQRRILNGWPKKWPKMSETEAQQHEESGTSFVARGAAEERYTSEGYTSADIPNRPLAEGA